MTTRVHGLTQTHINKLVEQIEAVGSIRIDQLRVDQETLRNDISSNNVQTEVILEDTGTAPVQITPEDELSKRMRKELAFYQMAVDELDITTIKLTQDTFLLKKLDAYRDALINVRDACFEILFCIDISK
jgi:hypothetical protein